MSHTKQSQDFKSKRQKYNSLLATRAKTLRASRDTTRRILLDEGLYDECKYLFCSGDASYIDDSYPRQQCLSAAFLRMVKEVKPRLSYRTVSSQPNFYIVSFMYNGTEFFAFVSREELEREGMIKDVD